MLKKVDDKWVTVRTEAEEVAALQADLARLSPEERAALQLMVAESQLPSISGTASIVESVADMEYARIPVGPRQYLEDPYYMGEVARNMFPKLRDDFINIFTGGYEELVATGSIGLDSLIQEADGGLPTLGERIGHSGDVVTVMDHGTDTSTTEPAHHSGIKKVLRLTLANGMSVTLTPDHEVLVRRLTGNAWVEARQIQLGDLVLCPRVIKTTPSSDISEDEAALLGYWTADGSSSDTRARFSDGNPRTAEHVMDLLSKFGFSGHRYKLTGSKCWEVSVSKVKTGGFSAWLQRHGVFRRQCGTVTVPQAVCRASNSAVAAFLRAVWAAEGSVYCPGNRCSPPRFALGMISERFIRQVQLLLLRFGVQARIRKTDYVDKRNGASRLIWHLVVTGAEQMAAFLTGVGPILGKEDACRRIADYCKSVKANTNVDLLPFTRGWLSSEMASSGVVPPRGDRRWILKSRSDARISRRSFAEWLANYGRTDLGQRLKSEFPDDVMYEPVVKLESVGVSVPVGDVGAHRGNRFVANGISVHNSIGFGKSFFGTMCLSYVLYQLSCLRNPAQSYGLAAGSQLHCVNLSARKDTAQRVIFDGVADKLELSPYFKEIGFERRKDSLRFPHNIVVVGGESTDSSVLGLSVIAAIVDETNFIKTSAARRTASGMQHYGRAEMLYSSIKSRMQSRFMKAGQLPGLLMLLSSRQVPDDFTETRIRQSVDDPKIYVMDYALWDVKPDNYSKERFKVFVGSGGQKPKILDADEKIQLHEGERIVEVPVDFRKRFEENLTGSLRDLAGVSVVTITNFLQNREMLFKAVDKTRVHPFSVDEWEIGTDGKFLWDKLVTKGADGEFSPIKFPEAVRYVHIDPSISGDATGLAMGCVCGFKRVVRHDNEGKKFEEEAPQIWVDLMLRIVPPQGGEIFLGDVRNLIYQLSERGFPISKVSMDSYQCMAAGTMVNTRRGLIPIEEVRVGDTVQSRIGPRAVQKTWSFGRKPTLRITTDDGDEIEGTDKHRIEVAVGWGDAKPSKYGHTREPIWAWKTLSEIKVGDIVHLTGATQVDGGAVKLNGSKKAFGWRKGPPSSIDGWAFPAKMTAKLAEWLGLVWGDGSVSEDGVRVSVTADEADDAKAVFRRLFGVAPEWHAYGDRNCGYVGVSARWLVRWMSANGLVKPLIPAAILRSGRRIKAAFLRGLFATDGSVGRTQGSVSLSTAHKVLADQVRLILRTDFGIESCLTKIVRGSHGDYPSTCNFQYVVAVRGARKEFLEKVGFSYARKQKLLSKHSGVRGRRIFPRVASVTRSEAEVYDLQVAEDPSYVANGFVSHNSIESLQQLRLKGYQTEIISVDAKMDPYEMLKGTLYEGRVSIYDYPVLINEMKNLELDWARRKVDHPIHGTKDVADALCGLVYSLTQKYTKKGGPNGYGAAPMQGISELPQQNTYVPVDSKSGKRGQILWPDEYEDQLWGKEEEADKDFDGGDDGSMPPFIVG
jgi:intein/homing endonuclease